MIIKRIIPILIFALALSMAKAQVLSINDYLSEMTDSTIFIITSDYVLRDTLGEDYVRKDNYYSRITGIGVNANGMLHLSRFSVQPWLIDQTFKKVDLSGAKKPVVSQVMVKPFPFINDIDVDLSLIDTTTRTVDDKGLTLNQPYLNVARNSGLIDSWIILYISENHTTGKLNKISYRKSLFYGQDGQAADLADILAPNGFIGGLVLIPSIKSGSIKVEISGLVYLDPLKKSGTLFWSPLQVGSELKKIEKKVTGQPPTSREETKLPNLDKKDLDNKKMPDKSKKNENKGKGKKSSN